MNYKIICLSEDSCCGGARASRIEIVDDRVYLKDRRKRTKVLTIEGWESAKKFILRTNRLPINIKNRITLQQVELEQLILFLKDESNIDPSRINNFSTNE